MNEPQEIKVTRGRFHTDKELREIFERAGIPVIDDSKVNNGALQPGPRRPTTNPLYKEIWELTDEEIKALDEQYGS